jgi:hypothetical protein
MVPQERKSGDQGGHAHRNPGKPAAVGPPNHIAVIQGQRLCSQRTANVLNSHTDMPK